MKRQRWLPMILVAVVLSALLTGTAFAKSRTSVGVTLSPHSGIGFWIGHGPAGHGYRHYPHGQVRVPGPWRHRVPGPWIPRRKVVVVSPPVVRRVVVPAPPVVERVIVPAPPVIRCEPTTITVWITNSNGSSTSVQLTRVGSWYRGPQGEYYASMPTNEQLRAVYGF
jgi:hypothetical protein